MLMKAIALLRLEIGSSEGRNDETKSLESIREMLLMMVDEHQVLVMQEMRLVAEMQKVKVVDDTKSEWSNMEKSCMC
ncbi:hypothetical protein Tco_0520182 [Tanacetum coccineum]